MVVNIEINNEKDAVSCLEKLLTGENLKPIFKDWPTLAIHAKGQQYHQSITSRNMTGLLEFQNSIYRIYAELKSGKPYISNLTNEEKNALEIVYNIENGSSNYIGEINEIVRLLASKMTSTELTITIMTALLLWFGTTAYSKHKDTQRQIVNAEQETKRSQIMADALSIANNNLKDVAETGSNAHIELLKGYATADQVEVQGEVFNRDEIESMTATTRTKASIKRLDGAYVIQMMDMPSPNYADIRIRVFSLETGNLLLSLTDEAQNKDTIKQLQEAQREKVEINLIINAKAYGDEIRNAELAGILNNKDN